MFDSPLSRSAYDVLGVDPSADAETIRRAFRQRLRATHPDTAAIGMSQSRSRARMSASS